MTNRSSGNVRMGPVGIFTLIILICLSVMAVLTAVTAHASLASAEKQAAYTETTYDNESKGWSIISIVDEYLDRLRSRGMDAQVAATLVTTDINNRHIPNTSAVSFANKIGIAITADNGRKLDILLDITNDLKPSITSWTVTTEPQSEGNDDVLWMNTL